MEPSCFKYKRLDCVDNTFYKMKVWLSVKNMTNYLIRYISLQFFLKKGDWDWPSVTESDWQLQVFLSESLCPSHPAPALTPSAGLTPASALSWPNDGRDVNDGSDERGNNNQLICGDNAMLWTLMYYTRELHWIRFRTSLENILEFLPGLNIISVVVLRSFNVMPLRYRSLDLW